MRRLRENKENLKNLRDLTTEDETVASMNEANGVLDEEQLDPNFNHIIIGVSSKSIQDDLDHIYFYKIIQ